MQFKSVLKSTDQTEEKKRESNRKTEQKVLSMQIRILKKDFLILQSKNNDEDWRQELETRETSEDTWVTIRSKKSHYKGDIFSVGGFDRIWT